MSINVQSINFDASEGLRNEMSQRAEILNKYDNRITHIKVTLRLDNNHSKDDKIVEIELHIPGNDVVVVKESNSFEKSMRLALSSARRILRKSKGKYPRFKLFKRAL